MAAPTVVLAEPWFSGSHKAWAEGYARYSRHEIRLVAGRSGGWRETLDESAPDLARQVELVPDALLASSMLDLVRFQRESGLTDVPTLVYMHENQLTYDPSKPDRARGAINWRSIEAADRVAFNSQFHLEGFFDAVRSLGPGAAAILQAREKAIVLPVGIDVTGLAGPDLRDQGSPVVLWSHRWEYDKDPDALVEAISDASDLAFRLILTGEGHAAAGFATRIRASIGERLVHAGYAEWNDYAALLHRTDLVLSTARQEFFGVSIAEAMACGAVPLVPDRLAYPELLGAGLADCLYEAGSLPGRLRAALSRPQEWLPLRPLAQAAGSRFAWEIVAPRYDDVIDSML